MRSEGDLNPIGPGCVRTGVEVPFKAMAEPESETRFPLAVVIVAWLFLLAGGATVIEMLIAIGRGEFLLSLGILNLFIGLGLLRRREGWRRFGAVWTAITLPVGVAVLVMALQGKPATFDVFGFPVARVSSELLIPYIVCMSCLACWELYVLCRPSTVALFRGPSKQAPA